MHTPSQFAIAYYDVGVIEGPTGDAIKKVLDAAVANGTLPNTEISMRTIYVNEKYFGGARW